mgnify:CR=1 FL=1
MNETPLPLTVWARIALGLPGIVGFEATVVPQLERALLAGHDVVMLGDDVGFYIPTQKTLYHGKVQDLRLLDSVFRQHRPSVVFHTAAYKHVPLVERNPVAFWQTTTAVLALAVLWLTARLVLAA